MKSPAFAQALVRNNPALVQLLGLCPLLAVTTSVTNALGLGLATAGVLVGSSVSVSLLRRHIPELTRLPIMMLIIAGMTTTVMLLMQTFAFDVYQQIALFVQIITTNCAILARTEQVARKQPLHVAFSDALGAAAGFLLALLAIGATRELLGHGSLFVGIDGLLGPWAAALIIRVDGDGQAFLLATLPPGAFLVTGALIGLSQWLQARRDIAGKASNNRTPS